MKVRPRALLALPAALFLAAGLAACGGDDDDDATGASTTAGEAQVPDAATVTLETSHGDIVIELDTEDAPIASGQFLKLAEEGFYDGLTFHRAVPDFVIQGGDPSGDGAGGSGSSVVGETPTDGYPIGSLAAAKAGTDPPGTFDSQFFIVTGENGTSLPPDYARFGMVVEGLDVAQAIEALGPPGGDGPPSETVTIEKVTVARP